MKITDFTICVNKALIRYGMVLLLMLFWGIQNTTAQNYYFKKALDYQYAGMRDTAFRTAKQGEQAGEVSSAKQLILYYLAEYGTPRNFSEAKRLIDKWYTKSPEICVNAINGYSPSDLYGYITTYFADKMSYNKSVLWGPENTRWENLWDKGKQAQSYEKCIQYARALLKMKSDDKYFEEKFLKIAELTLEYCTLSNKGGMTFNLSKFIKFNPQTKMYNPDKVDAYLSYKCTVSNTLADIGKSVNALKNILPPNTMYQRKYKEIYSKWEKFAEEHNINVQKLLTGTKEESLNEINRLREVYNTSNADIKSGLEIAIFSGAYSGATPANMNSLWVLDDTFKIKWTINQSTFMSDEDFLKKQSNSSYREENFIRDFENAYSDIMCDTIYVQTHYKKQYEDYKKYAEKKKIEEEQARMLAEKLLAEKNAKLQKQCLEEIHTALSTLTMIDAKGLKLWGKDVLLGVWYDKNRGFVNSGNISDEKKFIELLAPVFPITSYSIIEDSIKISPDGNECTATCEIMQVTGKGKKMKETKFRLTVYCTMKYSSEVNVNLARTFAPENITKIE